MEALDPSNNIPEDAIVFFKTREAHVFKLMLEFFHAALRTLVFVISKSGVRMRADNYKDDMNRETLMVDLDLPRQHFSLWKIPEGLEEDPDAILNLVIDASNFRMATQSILKKDGMTMAVIEDEPKQLQINIVNEDKGRNEQHTVTLIDYDSLPDHCKAPTLPCKYTITEPRAVGSASEFQKACKAPTALKSDRIHVIGQRRGIKFEATNDEVTRRFIYGLISKDEDIIYEQSFDVKGNIAAVAKCCTMSKNVRFYFEGTKSLLISLNTGESGTLDIYLVPIAKQ